MLIGEDRVAVLRLPMVGQDEHLSQDAHFVPLTSVRGKRVANTGVRVEIEYGKVWGWAARFTGNAGTINIICKQHL